MRTYRKKRCAADLAIRDVGHVTGGLPVASVKTRCDSKSLSIRRLLAVCDPSVQFVIWSQPKSDGRQRRRVVLRVCIFKYRTSRLGLRVCPAFCLCSMNLSDHQPLQIAEELPTWSTEVKTRKRKSKRTKGPRGPRKTGCWKAQRKNHPRLR